MSTAEISLALLVVVGIATILSESLHRSEGR